MAKNSSGHGRFVIAGLGFGVALGVAFGALVVAPAGSNDGEALTGGKKELAQAQQDAQIAEAQADTADSMVAQLTETTVEDTLHDRPVLVVRTRDAADADVDAVTWLLGKAGAIDAGVIELSGAFTSQDGADKLKTIVTNTLPAGAQLSEERLDPGTHAGEALGSALMLAPLSGEPQATEDERKALLEGLKDAQYIDYEAGTIRPAQIVVVITGDSDGSGDEEFGSQVIANFVQAMENRGNGVVLAGRVDAAEDTGAIGLVRETEEGRGDGDRPASTVDSLDREWARLATVLAAREQLDGDSGHYGAAESAEAAAPAVPEGEPD